MNLTQEDWWEKLQADENAVILDVRTEDEWNDGIIPNAINIDIYKGQGFIYQVEELDKSKNYYVYCKAGGRSAQACNIMNQMGFETTYNLMGGFSEWGGPVDMPKV
ncbi:rhodanese-like domain-containing protein [Flavobacterium humi]|uniref:Rhodanese-like domain-containing protein n=1 Tax=Flavobacterium humi TaxID=2562683 RepID=A0A4Z0LA04_9FLAO|nr:rhodanese-like domain-containing protein [Flavobacterium humi]TGD58900.1 rhodanese-like domain-containing protein [Flavobacterium humi]